MKMSKSNRKLIIVFAVAVILYIAIAIGYENNWFKPLNTYETPEKAIEAELDVAEYKYIIDNTAGIVSCSSKKSNREPQYIFKTDKGWAVITDNAFKNDVYYKDVGGYILSVREYENKYMVVVMNNTPIKEGSTLNVADSLNSRYEYMKNKTLFETEYKFCCIDSLPKGFTVSINGTDYLIEKS